MADEKDQDGTGGGEERRRTPRREMSPKIEAEIAGNAEEVGCWLRDISNSGARLELPEGTEIPAHITLKVGDEIYTCDKIWQGPMFVGVQFESNEYVRQLLERIYQLFDETDGNVGAIISLAQAARKGSFGNLNLPGLTDRLDQVAGDGRALIASMDELARDFGIEKPAATAQDDGGTGDKS